MTARRDPDHLIKAFLQDGMNELPDRAYDAVRSEIEHKRQRVVIGPWRFPRMNNYARFGLAAVAVLLVAVVGVNFLPGGGLIGGPGPTATSPATAPPPAATATAPSVTAAPPSQTPEPAASQAATRLPADAELAAGSYFITSRVITNVERLTFVVPDGWTAVDYGFVTKDEDGPGQVTFSPWNVTHIFTDACQWDENEIVAVRTADDIVNALAEQAGHDASAVEDTRVGGFPAKRIEWTIPADFDTSPCTNGNIRYWPGPGINRPDFTSGLCCERPGQTVTVYAVDVGDSASVIVAQHYPDSPASDRAELNGIVDSIEIVP